MWRGPSPPGCSGDEHCYSVFFDVPDPNGKGLVQKTPPFGIPATHVAGEGAPSVLLVISLQWMEQGGLRGRCEFGLLDCRMNAFGGVYVSGSFLGRFFLYHVVLQVFFFFLCCSCSACKNRISP